MASADVKSSEGFRMSHAVKAPYVPFYRSAPYPTIGVNFRKLQGKTLYKYCVANGINVREDSTQSELAVACARHFEAMKIEEANGIIGTFLHKCTEEAMAQPEVSHYMIYLQILVSDLHVLTVFLCFGASCCSAFPHTA